MAESIEMNKGPATFRLMEFVLGSWLREGGCGHSFSEQSEKLAKLRLVHLSFQWGLCYLARTLSWSVILLHCVWSVWHSLIYARRRHERF